MNKIFILGIAMFIVLPAGWSKDFNYESYTKTTLQDIITEEQSHSFYRPEAKQDQVYLELECKIAKYRVPCRYSNVSRTISEKKKKVIKMWLETLGIDPNFASLYSQEIQVTEGMNAHWIPIQKKMFPHISRELGKDDMVEIFLIFTGKVESEFVFIATEFQKSFSSDKKIIKAAASGRASP